MRGGGLVAQNRMQLFAQTKLEALVGCIFKLWSVRSFSATFESKSPSELGGGYPQSQGCSLRGVCCREENSEVH